MRPPLPPQASSVPTLLLRLSLRSKLLLMLLATSVCSILVIGYLGYNSGKKALTHSISDHLTSVRAAKAHAIQSYFGQVRHHTRALGEHQLIIDAAREFREAFHQLRDPPVLPQQEVRLKAFYQQEFLPKLASNLEGEPALETHTPETATGRYLQYHYLVANPHPLSKKGLLESTAEDGSSYSAAHQRFHLRLRNLIEQFHYYDLFLIDFGTGDILYTVQKEPDFATNLEQGPYRDSNLARLVRSVREEPDRGTVKLTDFKPYRPSLAAPAAFIATPVYDGARPIGILALQLPIDELNEVLTGKQQWRRNGLGDTGEIYLVGPDRLMRSASRFLIEDPEGYRRAIKEWGISERIRRAVERLGTTILAQEVDTPAVHRALEGREGILTQRDYRGVEVLSAYAPLDIPGVRWVILAEMDIAEAYQPVRAFERNVLISAAILVLVLTLVARYLSGSFLRPLRTLASAARQVAEGRHDVEVRLAVQDEVGELAETFNGMVRGIRQQAEALERKGQENEALLRHIIPGPVAQRLKQGEERVVGGVQQATVLSGHVRGLSELCERMSAEEAAALIARLMDACDGVAERHGVERVRGLTEGFLVVCGVSVPRLDHARRMTDFALDLQALLQRHNLAHSTSLELRAGLNCGPVVAGVVGMRRLAYDVWGPTVRLARHLEQQTMAAPLLITRALYERLGAAYELEARSDCTGLNGEPLPVWTLNPAHRPLTEVPRSV